MTTMTMFRKAVLAAALALSTPASAQEIHVITSGGFAAAYELLVPQFEAENGVTIRTEYGASGGGAPDLIPVRLANGETPDLILLSREGLDLMTEEGRVIPETRTDLARSLIGVSVRAGEAHPDISTPEAFIATLRAADSIGYSASASGTYLSEDLFPRIGVWDELEGKSTRVVSERVGAVLARGEFQLAFQQVSELLPIEGIEFVGTIPEEFQQVTMFSGGVTTMGDNAQGAQALLDFLSSPDVAEVVTATGLDPVD